LQEHGKTLQDINDHITSYRSRRAACNDYTTARRIVYQANRIVTRSNIMANAARTIAQQLDDAHRAISNTLANPDIQVRVSRYGYTTERMLTGKALYDTAVQTVNTQAAAAGASRRATAQTQTAKAEAHKRVGALANVARSVFARGSAEWTELELTRPIPRNAAEFLTVATTLVDNALALPNIQVALAEYGYDEQQLLAEREKIIAFSNAREAQAQARTASLNATRAQTAALKELRQWVSRYRKIAATAFTDAPQLARSIGITIASPTRRALPKSEAVPQLPPPQTPPALS
jgi:hypothetical protein